MDEKRVQSEEQEFLNATSHAIGIIVSFVGLVLLIIKTKTLLMLIGVIVFGLSALNLYTISFIYHIIEKKELKGLFRILDHCSVYLLIGGSFLPVFLSVYNYPNNLIYIIIQWTVIVAALLFKVLMFDKCKAIHYIVYILLGWSGLIVFWPIWNINQNAFFLLLAGGLSYTIGLIFFATIRKYSHFIWHLFVLAGTTIHFVTIFLYFL